MNGKALLALGAVLGAGLLLGSKKGGAAPLNEPPAGDGDPPNPKTPSTPKPKPPTINAVKVTGPSGNRYTVQRSSGSEVPTWIVRSEQFPGVFVVTTKDLDIISKSNPSSELSLLEQDLDALTGAFR